MFVFVGIIGIICLIIIYSMGGHFESENYHLSLETLNTALLNAGLNAIEWKSPQLSSDGLKHNEPSH